MVLFGSTKISDAAAPGLVKLPQVEELLLTAPRITDTTVERLAPLKGLTCLYFNGSQAVPWRHTGVVVMSRIETSGLPCRCLSRKPTH